MHVFNKVVAHVLAATMILSPFVIFFALPIFDDGVFRQVETVALGIHLIAAFVCLLLFIMAASAFDDVPSALRNPAVIALMAIAVSGVLMMPFVLDWAKSLHGTLEHGVGILWHAETAMLAVGAIVAWRSCPAWRPALASAPAVTVTICAILQVLNLPYQGADRFTVYVFPGYLGVNAMFAAVPLLALNRRWATAAGVAIAISGVWLGGNRSTFLAILFAIACVAILRRFPKSIGWLTPVGVVMVISIAFALPASLPFLESLGTASLSDPLPHPEVLSEAPIDHVAIQLKSYGTIWDRSEATRQVVATLISKPSILLTGDGFGSFDSVAETMRRSVHGRQSLEGGPGASLAYWDGGTKAKFHSHNMFWEMILSAGVLAMMAWLALVWSICRRVDVDRPMAGATLAATLIVGGSLWFFVNAAAPLIAIAIAAVTTPLSSRESGKSATVFDMSLAMTVCCLGLAVFGAAGAFTKASIHGEKMERGFFPLSPIKGRVPCLGFEALSLPDMEINSALYNVMIKLMTEHKSEAKQYFDIHKINIANYSCLMRGYAKRGNVLALLDSLKARTTLVSLIENGDTVVPQIISPDFKLWSDDLDRLLAMAPGRTDMIIPYIAWLDPVKHPEDVEKAVAHFLPMTETSDPVHWWLVAADARARELPDDYRQAIRQALKEGLANIISITKTMADFGERKS